MEPSVIGTRLASAVVGPLVKKLFATEGPGAGMVDKPIRIAGYVSFKGEKRTLTDSDVRDLAAKLVKQALRTGERPIPADEHQAVTDALAKTLHALGDLTITDLDAVRLGHQAFARELRRASANPEQHLTADATYFYERLLDTACLHILHFFTQRSTFVAHTLVEQTRTLAELTTKIDELIRRSPLPGGEDAAFEQRYLSYVAKKHGKLTIYGIDLDNSPDRWPLDLAYLSLEASPLAWHGAVADPWIPADVERLMADPEFITSARGSAHAMLQSLGRGGGITLNGTEEGPVTSTSPPSDHWPATHGRLFASGSSMLRSMLDPQPADQALATSKRVLLRGEAGSGKTTLVQWLAVTPARQDLDERMTYLYDRIPFVLPLRTLTRHGERLPTPKDFLSAVNCPLSGSQPAGWEDRVLTAGRGLILIDGIDEIPNAERERTRAWLRDLLETFSDDNRWLITSRPSAVNQGWLAEDKFTELTLSAMSPSDVGTFIKRWHAAARAESDDLDSYEPQLLTAVRTKPDLGRLATNPLMCGLICALHRDRRGYLPHGRKDLYEAALTMLLSRRDRERDMVGPELREEPQLDLLQRLAYWLIKNGRTEMDRSRAESIIGKALPAVPEAAALGDASTVFEHFLHRSGLLREPAPGTVDFVHRTFQDFLGARAAVEEEDFGLLADHASDDQWEDVIRMAVALARPRERITIFQDLLAAGAQTPDKPTQARVYLLAAACLEHATALDPSVREAVEQRTATLIPPRNEEEARSLAEAGPLILDLLPGPEKLDPLIAWHVAVAASHVKSQAAISFLARFARYPFLSVRSQLMWAWSRFDSAQYADEVIAHLDPSNLDYTIQSDEQLHHLTRLRLQPSSLDVRGGVSMEALVSYLSQNAITDLKLSNASARDLGFLTGQAALETLVISDCPELVDLSAIGGLTLRLLDISSPRADVDLQPISQLPDLGTLRVSGPTGLNWSPETLPAHAPLRELSVSGYVSPVRGLKGLGDFSLLSSLVLNLPSSPVSAADWQDICSLSSLANLTMAAASFDNLPASATLRSVTTLALIGGGGERVVQAAIRRLPEAFPELKVLLFSGDMSAEGDIDVAPLAGLSELLGLHVTAGRDRIRGVETLPASVTLGYHQ